MRIHNKSKDDYVVPKFKCKNKVYTLTKLINQYSARRGSNTINNKNEVIAKLRSIDATPIQGKGFIYYELSDEDHEFVLEKNTEFEGKYDKDSYMDARLMKAQDIVDELKKEGVSVNLLSDGYHTYGELYYHRMRLFEFASLHHKDKFWKSMLHDDGTMFEDSFIVGVTTPEGNYTYHYDEKFWDHFDVQVLDRAPEYDGHKPEDIGRLFSLLK